MSIASKLTQLAGIKSDIKEAIIAKGQTVGDDMTEYASAISNISGGGSVPTLLGWISASDVAESLDADGSGNIAITDWMSLISNYTPGNEYGGYSLSSSDIDANTSSGSSTGAKYGYEMISGDQAPCLVKLARSGSERWAIIDVQAYFDDGLGYDYYAVYDGKPNLNMIGAK